MNTVIPPLAGDPVLAAASTSGAVVGALWRRFVAFLVDGIILGFAGTIIAMPFFDAFVRLGAWGRLVGFCIALPYYALLNSKVGNGQTLGKKLLGLRVVNNTGLPISFSKSIARYVVLSVPFFLNQLTLPMSKTPEALLYLIGFLIFGLGFLTIYLVLFNRRTRQGPHDLIAGSYVVDASRPGEVTTQPIWVGHWVLLGCLVLSGCIGWSLLQKKLSTIADFPAMMADIGLIENIPEVQAAGVSDMRWSSWGGAHKRIYVVTVKWRGPGAQSEGLANRVVDIILQNDPNARSRDVLQVTIIRGYDLGIAHGQVSKTFEDSPENWNSKLHPDKRVVAPKSAS